MVCSFFKCSFVLRVGAVIFELDKVSMSKFVQFKFLSITLNIERVFEEEKNGSKTGRKGHDFSKLKGPRPMQNFLHEEKIQFFL